ncbi:hypothetical protein PYCCODRAFT_1466768 [Trametes coccinea BRFM310]|uniref:Uncharacterized protein n=1 Tax=Trametes coccinea (strain BRFM310) TaxID=1353009 RepID=A0A1Y2IVA4_TRAC3|nr:hypothetical protein PYCCODRAFT_1466768 [Trametes coccinea BRFM310]
MPFSLLHPESFSMRHSNSFTATQLATASTTQPSSDATALLHHLTPSHNARPPLEPALGLVLISAIGAAFIVSTLCLFCMSRHRPRWRVLLFCAPLVIALGLVHASLNIFVQMQVLTGTAHQSRGTSILHVIIALSLAIPILGASLALLTIGTLCSHVVSWKLRMSLYGPSVAFKVFRIGVYILCMVDIARRTGTVEELPRAKAAASSCLQLGDDLCTLILMVVPRLRTQNAQRDVDSEMSLGTSVSSHTRRCTPKYSQIAAGAFMILFMLDVAQLILTCRPSPVHHDYAGSYLVTVNLYFQIICATLVLLWYHPIRLSYKIWCRRGGQPAVPEDESMPMTARLLSPLPQHPGLHVLLADSGYGQGADRSIGIEDSTEPNKFRADKVSVLPSKPDDIVVQTQTVPSAFRERTEMEPSMVSYNGSFSVDEYGRAVFYAM